MLIKWRWAGCTMPGARRKSGEAVLPLARQAARQAVMQRARHDAEVGEASGVRGGEVVALHQQYLVPRQGR